MDLLVRYQPTSEDWYKFNLEENITITKQRSKPATCNVQIPTTFSTINASGYGKLQVLLNDQYLFDGRSQIKTFSKDKIKLTGYDYLWDFSHTRRIFQQGATAVTPSQLFTDVFDTAGTSSYITGIWGESYTGPWIDGFDATTYVVPAQTSATYGTPFFDCNNKHGMDFMKFLADLSYRGAKYKYFYRFENINGTKYLFFEPDGWGRTWKNVNYDSSSNLTESYENLYNDVAVWGRSNVGYIPTKDRWTESTCDGWTCGAGCAVSQSTGQVDVGLYSLQLAFDGTEHTVQVRHALTVEGGDGINIDNLDELQWRLYVPAGAFQPEVTVYLLAPSGAHYFDTGYEAIAVGGGAAAGWATVDFAKSEFGTGGGSPDWTDIKYIYIVYSDVGDNNFLTGNWYMDDFYFKLNPYRSANSSTTTGYDATSAGIYGRRTTPPIIFKWIEEIADCNSYATTLMNYYKDPQYSINLKFDSFKNFNVNDNIKFTYYEKDLTLPIEQLVWSFKPEGKIETSVTLGSRKLTLPDLLGKFSQDIVEPGKEWGLQYYVF